MQKVELHHIPCRPIVLATHVMLQARRCILSMLPEEVMIVVLMPSIGDWQKATAFLLSGQSAKNQVLDDIAVTARRIQREQKTAPRSRVDYLVCVMEEALLDELMDQPDIIEWSYLDHRVREIVNCLQRQEQARAGLTSS